MHPLGCWAVYILQRMDGYTEEEILSGYKSSKAICTKITQAIQYLLRKVRCTTMVRYRQNQVLSLKSCFKYISFYNQIISKHLQPKSCGWLTLAKSTLGSLKIEVSVYGMRSQTLQHGMPLKKFCVLRRYFLSNFTTIQQRRMLGSSKNRAQLRGRAHVTLAQRGRGSHCRDANKC